jgi:hypothetical protein
MRIKHKVNVRIADDADFKNFLFAPDDALSEVIIDAYYRQTSGKFKILMNTDEDISLGDIAAVKGIYIKVNKDAVVTLNGGAETIQMRRAGATSSDYAKLFLEADITAVNIAAPVTEDLEGIFCAWGDST